MISRKLIGVVASLAAALGPAARADIVSDLEVHYEFEDSDNFGHNSVGTDGITCG